MAKDDSGRKIEFGKPLEPPKAKSWKPKKGETRIFELAKIVKGLFGPSYLVIDYKTKEELFLPHHIMLTRRLNQAKLDPGYVFQITCITEGSPAIGDTYDYEVRLAKKNPPF